MEQARIFAACVDFVPDVGGIYAYPRQRLVFHSAEDLMSWLYGEILHAAKVSHYDLSEQGRAELARLGSLLFSKRTVRDTVTGGEVQVTEYSPIMKAYDEKRDGSIARESKMPSPSRSC